MYNNCLCSIYLAVIFDNFYSSGLIERDALLKTCGTLYLSNLEDVAS